MTVIHLEKDDNTGVYTLYLHGKEVGYISKVQYKADRRRGFRGVSVHGDIIYAYGLLSAQRKLLEAYH